MCKVHLYKSEFWLPLFPFFFHSTVVWLAFSVQSFPVCGSCNSHASLNNISEFQSCIVYSITHCIHENKQQWTKCRDLWSPLISVDSYYSLFISQRLVGRVYHFGVNERWRFWPLEVMNVLSFVAWTSPPRDGGDTSLPPPPGSKFWANITPEIATFKESFLNSCQFLRFSNISN